MQQYMTKHVTNSKQLRRNPNITATYNAQNKNKTTYHVKCFPRFHRHRHLAKLEGYLLQKNTKNVQKAILLLFSLDRAVLSRFIFSRVTEKRYPEYLIGSCWMCYTARSDYPANQNL